MNWAVTSAGKSLFTLPLSRQLFVGNNDCDTHLFQGRSPDEGADSLGSSALAIGLSFPEIKPPFNYKKKQLDHKADMVTCQLLAQIL